MLALAMLCSVGMAFAQSEAPQDTSADGALILTVPDGAEPGQTDAPEDTHFEPDPSAVYTPEPLDPKWDVNPTATLRYGSSGAMVRLLQERLTELGYYSFRITGQYQDYSRNAVNLFQKEHGLPQTGVATVELQRLIFSQAAMPHATPTPKPTPEPTPAPTLPDTAPEFKGNVEYDSTGTNVKYVQIRLAQLGYYGGVISGEFYKNTRNAVISFQNNNGLYADGVVGPKTWELLFNDPAPRDAAAAPTPKPTPAPPKYYMTIDVVNQLVSVYSQDANGEYTNLVRRMLCSTGTDSNPTPARQYVLNGATARWCFFDKWGSYAQYWTRISSSIAFHSVIYNTPNSMDLATGSYFNLGSKASHGCIRLLVSEAKWIYENCGAGTVVDVIQGIPDPEGTKALKPPALNYSNMLPVTTPQPTPTPEYDPHTPPSGNIRTLEVGSEGADVYWLQRKLTELGYYKGSITGGYWNGTRDAVKAYQKANGLSADGKAGRITLSQLYAEAMVTPTPSPSPTPIPTPEPTATAVPTATPAPSSEPLVTPEPTDTPDSEAQTLG